MTQNTLIHSCHFPTTRRRAGLLDFFSLMRQRRALARLEDHMLRDIGITREHAQAETRRPVWDAPENWHNQLY